MDVALRIFVLNFYHAPMFLFVTSADKVMFSPIVRRPYGAQLNHESTTLRK